MDRICPDITIEKCKELIHKYQKDRDPETLRWILFKLDHWVISFLRKIEYFSWLKGEDMNDVYGEALIGLHNGILVIPERWRAEKTYLYLGGYIKNQLRNKYRYKKFELMAEDVISNDLADDEESMKAHQIIHQYSTSVKVHKQEVANMDVRLLVDTPGLLTERERKYIDLFYFQGLGGPEVATIMGCHRSWVLKERDIALAKLRKYAQGELRCPTETSGTSST